MKLFSVLLVSICFISAHHVYSQQTLYGDTVQLGNGVVYSWVSYNSQGTRNLIGFSLSQGALDNLPVSPAEVILPLPVSGTDTLFNHIYVNWNPGGHPPGYWSLPHFDIHYMMVSIAEREAVVGGPDSALLPQYIPQDYITDGNVVPRMGAHWVDTTTPELHGETFTQTLIYGFYRHKMFFVEPMITRAYLLTHPDDTFTVKQPEQYLRTGYFPTAYMINYDANTQRYNIVLRDFVLRFGNPIGIQSTGENIPDKFIIYQNYPNPFNPVTNIKFDIPQKSFVKLSIFNTLGQEIASLINEELNAGSYKADWNAGSYPSGVYFYKLETGSFSETKKMILIK